MFIYSLVRGGGTYLNYRQVLSDVCIIGNSTRFMQRGQTSCSRPGVGETGETAADSGYSRARLGRVTRGGWITTAMKVTERNGAGSLSPSRATTSRVDPRPGRENAPRRTVSRVTPVSFQNFGFACVNSVFVVMIIAANYWMYVNDCT